MKIIPVNTASAYEVKIGSGLLCRLGDEAVTVCKGRTAVIISDSNVFPLYGEIAANSLKKTGFSVVSYVFSAGESSKNGSTYLSILNFLAENHVTRADCLIALGGGVVGDMTGFVAATYLRGIAYIQLPTTLLAAVDSSVGGKTAIDLPAGKNLAGAFWQPKLVLMDPDCLNTLSDKIFSDGMAEVIKYGCIRDAAFFDLLQECGGRAGVMAHIEQVLYTCCGIKRDIVQADERESGLRMLLNFGHTIGHGIETAAGLDRLYHGECVALGMLPMCGEALRPRVQKILEKLKLPTTCRVDPDKVWKAVSHDKKLSGDTITVVYSPKAGTFQMQAIPLQDLKETVFTFLDKGV